MSSKIYIGTSGYMYKHWKGDFYPRELPVSRWFDHYSKFFDTVEINNTFYRMPGAETFENWRKVAPKGFCYGIKYSKYGTHNKKLKDPEAHLQYFLDRATHLEEKLGPILVQLPPHWKRNYERLEAFLTAAPGELRWAVEIRDPDWFSQELYGLLKKHQVSLVIHDMIKEHPIEITANWVYLRFHGENYSSSYSEKQLQEIAARVEDHRNNDRDVFVYFNNDIGGHAVRNAISLKQMLKLG